MDPLINVAFANYSACRRRGGVLNSPHFCFFLLFFSVSEVGAALMGDTAGPKPREPTLTRRLNPISSGICQQNTHFNMYARTSKPLEGFTCKNSHAKCFKTANSIAKLYRGAMYRGEVLKACFRTSFSVVFPLLRNQISTQESNFYTRIKTQILLKYLYTKHNS